MSAPCKIYTHSNSTVAAGCAVLVAPQTHKRRTTSSSYTKRKEWLGRAGKCVTRTEERKITKGLQETILGATNVVMFVVVCSGGTRIYRVVMICCHVGDRGKKNKIESLTPTIWRLVSWENRSWLKNKIKQFTNRNVIFVASSYL